VDLLTRALRLLWELRGLEARIRVEEGALRVEGPLQIMTPELRTRIAEARSDLLGLLSEPCRCVPCTRGEPFHGPNCYCAACVHADPEREKYCAEADAEDAAAKADAEYEAEECAAIQEEGCTAAELEALRAARQKSVAAGEATIPRSTEAGSPGAELLATDVAAGARAGT
jgi:hypothetical protein